MDKGDQIYSDIKDREWLDEYNRRKAAGTLPKDKQPSFQIYCLERMDAEGRSVVGRLYFEDVQDAYKIGGFDNDGKKIHMANPDNVTEITVWRAGRYSLDEEDKKKALSKLTDRERQLLGIK
jgi:hypothetical protein